MIKSLSTKYQKTAALLLFVLMCLETTLPALASVASPMVVHYAATSTGRNKLFTNDFTEHNKPGLNTFSKKTPTDASRLTSDKPSAKNTPSQKADIGGPGQPEMSSFKSVNSNDMVDLFTGDFSYNIPLLDVGGYPVNIHYSSSISMDQEASWVGLGWNINPGTINRSMRGLPDDFDGTDSIAKTMSVKPNKTVGVTVGADVEITGTPIGLGATYGVFQNTYNGWGIENGINASINSGSQSYGPLSGSLSITNNSQSGLNVSPSMSVRLSNHNQDDDGRSVTLGLSTNYNSRAGIAGLQLNTAVRLEKKLTDDQQKNYDQLRGMSTSYPYAGISFALPSYTPSITMPFTSTNYSFRGKLGGEISLVHPSVTIEGYVSKQEIKKEDTLQVIPAVGYLYYSKSNNRTDALLDVNREKELSFNPKTTPHIAIPQYTYDVYSISGEGTGGMFRPYRGDIGYVRDYSMRTKSKSDKLSVDLGFGNIFHGGVDFFYTNSYTENNLWSSNNDINNYLRFQNSDTTFQPVYFRNPGEQTSNATTFYQSVGDDALMRVKLDGPNSNVKAANSFITYKNNRATGEVPVNANLVKKQRDKRSQVISYLTAGEAADYGFDKNIISYKENTIPVSCNDTATVINRYGDKTRKKNHLSEIAVLNSDGRRYLYGIPAYNVSQVDVTFSVDEESNSADIDKGLVSYTPGNENSTANVKGKEGYFSKDSTPGYAHSFLLSGILSPDYVDIKDDGLTEDDLGDAVKFNYSRVYGDDNCFEWRTPYDPNKANSNEGLKTYSRDDKGTYLYGKKEVWYLNSIVSKTMIAVFRLSKDRKDVYSVKGENGGIDTTRPLRKLDRIDLYTKADLVKNGVGAKPIKTVHFAYSYDLCKGVAGDTSKGKLTLDSIWFSYNKNEKGKLNPYVFRYHPGKAEYNPSYHPKHYDRWGNYKNPESNPGGMSNSDYPYAEQDSTKAATFAAAWTLSEIKLPSGGHIEVSYESDSYAYIQNKRATRFFQLAGVSNSINQPSGTTLYSSSADNYYVFINSSMALSGKKDIYQKYLEGNDYIYFKIAVKMQTDRWGGGYEFIPVYAKVEDYGLVPGTNNKFWLKLEGVEGESPLARNAVQFLRLNLPSKAYPASELGDNINVWDAVKMLASSVPEVKNAVRGFGKEARNKEWCKEIKLNQSFARLACPSFVKYGGGLRVKRIEVFDNWNKMTGQKEATYGQEYSYTTVQEVNGQKIEISSGVASYEPMIGAEENPFRTPIEYAEKLAPLAPANNLFSENPLGESFFPAPSVGYSKVRVRTIHAKAKSANGWQETEFFTTRDFPTIVESTVLDDGAKKPYNPNLRNFLRINSVHHITVSQGFKIELNDMNGKVKRQANYSENDPMHSISYVQNFYKVDNDKALQKHLNNTVWVVDSLNGHINTEGTIGKDIEVMTDMREQVSRTVSNDKSANIDITSMGFIFAIPTLLSLPQREETRFRSAAVVKVIQRYGILDSVVAMDKGSIVSTKNLIYDAETGSVVLSKTNNEFNDPVYNFSYPAHWAYGGMGMAYKNIDALFTNLLLKNGKLFYANNDNVFPVERFFESGDEIQTIWRTGNMDAVNCLQLNVAPDAPQLSGKIWAIDAAKGKEKHRGIYFIDKEGNPLTGKVASMRILRSGKRNMLDASVGSIVALANPIKEISAGVFRLNFDTASKVINTSAVTYKDFWKVENSLYAKDTVFRVYKDFGPFYLSPKVNTRRLDMNGLGAVQEESYIENSKNIATSFDYIPSRSCVRSRNLYTKSILDFNLSMIPSGAMITSATLSFSPRVPNDLWWKKSSGKGNIFCPNTYSYDWSQATNYYAGSSGAVLKRITGSWGNSTSYNAFQTTSANQISLSSASINTNINCTSLIQDVVNNPRYGLMFELLKSSAGSNNYQTDYLDFCAANEYSTGNAGGGYNKTFSSTTTCSQPVLTIMYRTVVDSIGTVCRQNINDTSVNPYRWGILGNWRTDRVYTYYSDRKESDATVLQTDIRREGELKSFTSYWQFTDSVLTNRNADTSKWVWNSASALYNNKGFEIENYDPLGRYNAGLYGYNQTLPVAVAQNSKNREIMFDGFEDYGYKTKPCTTCPSPKELDFLKNNAGVDTSQLESHTGRYSVKVNAGAQAALTVPMTTLLGDTIPAALSLKIDSTPVYTQTVVGTGQGLSATYAGYPLSDCNSFFPGRTVLVQNSVQGPIDYAWGNNSPFSGWCNRWYQAVWKGNLQAPFTDFYTFHTIADGGVSVAINGITISSSYQPNKEVSSVRLLLQAGKLYTISVFYSHFISTEAKVSLRWSRDNDAHKVIVPKNFLYRDSLSTSDTVGSVIRDIKYYCIKANNPAPQQLVRPHFSPVQSSKMILSAWVKMEGNDCNTAPALENVVTATLYSPSGDQVIALQKTGVRIEGWQRYESVVTMPWNGTQLKVSAVAPPDRSIYVDDIRMQPFNSTMKSYVYDPVSLRLMAELDENNYASFYEYDDDGTLIRVKKETERGVMTIKETRSALLKDN